jgi:hypothetical protein
MAAQAEPAKLKKATMALAVANPFTPKAPGSKDGG